MTHALQWLLFLSLAGVLVYVCVLNLRRPDEPWDDWDPDE